MGKLLSGKTIPRSEVKALKKIDEATVFPPLQACYKILVIIDKHRRQKGKLQQL